MKTIEALLLHIKDLDVKLYADGDHLHCTAPKGKLTPALKKQLADHKTEILKFLQAAKWVNSANNDCQALSQICPRPSERYQPFPLTDVQQAYWVGRNDVFELSNISTHAYAEIDVVNLDVRQFEKTLNRIIERHEMMRAIIRSDGQQQILEEVPPYQVKVLDLRASDAETAHSQLMAIRDRMSHQILPIDQYPLFEFCAVQLSQSKTRLYASIDLLISDAWSFEVLKQEFIQLIHHPECSLPPLDLSFRDYVLAEISLRNSDLYRRSLAYWKSRLHTLPPAPELPLDKNLAAISQPRFVHRTGRLHPELWSRLKRRGQQANLTPSVLVLAAFAEILTTWSKSPRFTINVTLFKRLPLHPQVNQIVGDFTSLALLAVDNFAQNSFEVRAQQIQKQLWDDLDHRYVSGLEVLREIARLQKRPSGALMPVVYTSTLGNESVSRDAFIDSLTQAASATSLPSEEIGEVVYSLSQTPQVYLDHQVIEEDDALVLNWDAIENLFPPGLLDDMFAAYTDFLQRLATSEELWTGTTRNLLPVHQRQQQATVNATEAPILDNTLLHSLFEKQVITHPQHLAVVSSQKTLTYQELSRRANCWGDQLRQGGVCPNQLVAIVMEKGWEQVVAVLSILIAGAAYVPIDPELPIERQHTLLKQSEVRWVLTQSNLNAKLDWPDNVQRLCVDLDDAKLWETSLSHQPMKPLQTPDDLAYVIYTSGSTGMPKGVMIDHKGAVNTVLDINRRFQINASDRVLALSSLSFDLSVYDLFGTLAAGGTVIIPDADGTRSPAHWAMLMMKYQVTVWNSVPALMQLFVEYAEVKAELQFYPLRLVLLSGDWIPLSLPKQIKELSE
ncbi:MAG TPA: AMP-binding protein, partial [Elainellaceae cyanobacterium]